MLFKRFLAVFLVLMLSLSLCGCVSKKDVIGSYEAQLDISEIYNRRFSEAEDIKNYSLSSLTLKQSLTFNQDGTYSYYVEEEEAQNVINKALILTSDALRQYYAKLIADMGLNMDVETYLASVGADIDSIVAQMRVSEEIENILEKLCEEGTYTVTRTSLFTGELAGWLSNYSYNEEYSFEDNTVTVNCSVLQEQVFYTKQ